MNLGWREDTTCIPRWFWSRKNHDGDKNVRQFHNAGWNSRLSIPWAVTWRRSLNRLWCVCSWSSTDIVLWHAANLEEQTSHSIIYNVAHLGNMPNCEYLPVDIQRIVKVCLCPTPARASAASVLEMLCNLSWLVVKTHHHYIFLLYNPLSWGFFVIHMEEITFVEFSLCQSSYICWVILHTTSQLLIQFWF